MLAVIVCYVDGGVGANLLLSIVDDVDTGKVISSQLSYADDRNLPAGAGTSTSSCWQSLVISELAQ